MYKKDKGFFIGFVCAMLIIAGLSPMILDQHEAMIDREWRKKCTKIGVAKYDAVTGKWKWKEEYDKKLESEDKNDE